MLACCFVSLLSLCSIQLAFSSRYSLRGRSARVSCFRFSYFVNALRVFRAVTGFRIESNVIGMLSGGHQDSIRKSSIGHRESSSGHQEVSGCHREAIGR